MKKKLSRLLITLLLLALFAVAFMGMIHLSNLHRAEYPWLHADAAPQNILPFIGGAACLLLFGTFAALCGKVCGYRFLEMRLLFLHVRKEEGRLRFRLGKPGLGTLLLPPHTDGTSPWRLFMVVRPLFFGLMTLILLLLTISAWGTTAFRSMLLPVFLYLGMTLISLLPRKNGMDPLSLWRKFSRCRDCVRAWECASHIAAALYQGQKLMDMPEEWFGSYPAELAEDPHVSNCMINGSSWLMRQYRFAEAYAMLEPMLDLPGTPDTHHTIACAILNGAVCEAMADELPRRCIDQLEHPAVKYMCPPGWQIRLVTVKYARAMLVDRNADEAAALLPALEEAAAQDQVDGGLLQRIQAKAGETA